MHYYWNTFFDVLYNCQDEFLANLRGTLYPFLFLLPIPLSLKYQGLNPLPALFQENNPVALLHRLMFRHYINRMSTKNIFAGLGGAGNQIQGCAHVGHRLHL